MSASTYNSTNGIYTSPDSSISFPSDPNLSMISFLFRRPDSYPDRPALIDSDDRQTLTFRQLRSAVSTFASSLSRLGIRRGDVVLIFSPNSILFPASFLSIVSLGAIATTVNPQYTVGELKKQALDSGAKLVLTVPDLVPTASSLNLPIILLAENSNKDVSFPTFYDLIENRSPAELTPPEINQDDTAALLYSSGTTGASKGVVLTHRNFISTATMIAAADGGERERTYLCFLPMFHVFGLSIVNYTQLARGNTVVVMERFEMEKMLGAIERFRVSHLFLVPPVMIGLAKQGMVMRRRFDLGSLRWVCSGAAPLGRDVMEEVGNNFPEVEFVQVVRYCFDFICFGMLTLT